jgi:hypothetical protein
MNYLQPSLPFQTRIKNPDILRRRMQVQKSFKSKSNSRNVLRNCSVLIKTDFWMSLLQCLSHRFMSTHMFYRPSDNYTRVERRTLVISMASVANVPGPILVLDLVLI